MANRPGVDRVAAEDRAERQRGAVARRRAPGRAPWRSARRRAARSSARPGWRTACRASRRRARGRSSRSPAAAARAGSSSAPGRRSRGSAGPGRRPGPRRRPGSRWMPVISAPESVVGIAATSAPRDRGDRLGGVDHPSAAEGDEAARRRPRRAAPRPSRAPGRPGPGARPAAASRRRSASPTARSVVSSSKRLEAVLGEQLGARPAARSSPKTTTRPASRQMKPDAVAPVTARGLTTGRSFGSTSSRRCSKSGGSESFSPEVLERLVDREARPERGDLEEHPARLAEVDRLEVEAVDHRGRLGAGRDRPLAPLLVLVDRRGPGDVVDAAGALERALRGWLVVEVEAAARVRRAPPSRRRACSNSSASSSSVLASGAAL